MADGIRIEVKGIKELKHKFSVIESELNNAILAGIADSGLIVVKTARGRVVVGTGNLRDHINEQGRKVTKTRIQVDVGVRNKKVPYAARIEYGYTGPDKLGRTFHQKARPYLRNSLNEKETEIRRVVESKITDVIRRHS